MGGFAKKQEQKTNKQKTKRHAVSWERSIINSSSSRGASSKNNSVITGFFILTNHVSAKGKPQGEKEHEGRRGKKRSKITEGGKKEKDATSPALFGLPHDEKSTMLKGGEEGVVRAIQATQKLTLGFFQLKAPLIKHSREMQFKTSVWCTCGGGRATQVTAHTIQSAPSSPKSTKLTHRLQSPIRERKRRGRAVPFHPPSSPGLPE